MKNDHETLIRAYGRVNSLRRTKFASLFEGLPLTCIQALTLHYVMYQADFGEVYPKEIERFLTIRGSSVNSLLNFLERDGYIVREATAVDGRYKRVVPTEKAQALRGEIVQRIDRFVKEMFENIPEADMAGFERALGKIEQNLTEMN